MAIKIEGMGQGRERMNWERDGKRLLLVTHHSKYTIQRAMICLRPLEFVGERKWEKSGNGVMGERCAVVMLTLRLGRIRFYWKTNVGKRWKGQYGRHSKDVGWKCRHFTKHCTWILQWWWCETKLFSRHLFCFAKFLRIFFCLAFISVGHIILSKEFSLSLSHSPHCWFSCSVDMATIFCTQTQIFYLFYRFSFPFFFFFVLIPLVFFADILFGRFNPNHVKLSKRRLSVLYYWEIMGE